MAELKPERSARLHNSDGVVISGRPFSRTQPIWMPRVVIAPDGTTLAAWIDQNDPTETVRAAALPPAGTWQRPVTLENASGLTSVELRAGAGDLGVLAWQDTVAGETRARVTTSDWTTLAPVATIASSLDNLVHLTLAGPAATRVRWEIGLNPISAKRFEARRTGTTWTRPIPTARPTPATRRAGARPSGSLASTARPGLDRDARGGRCDRGDVRRAAGR
jgi:hypothetical protein